MFMELLKVWDLKVLGALGHPGAYSSGQTRKMGEVRFRSHWALSNSLELNRCGNRCLRS
jgi:hypothetical protein